MNSEEEIIWMAGFFEGEGYIGVLKHAASWNNAYTTKYEIHVAVSNTSKESIGLFIKHFGGKVYEIHREHENPNWQIQYSWKYPADIKKFLDTLYPYLIFKKKQFDLAYEFLSIDSRMPRYMIDDRERVYKEFKAIHSPIGRQGRKRKPVIQYTMGV